jgi:hypothetical protein
VLLVPDCATFGRFAKHRAELLSSEVRLHRVGEVCLEVGMEPTFIPTVGQRVCVVDRNDDFVVIRVDRRRHKADLMHMFGTRRVETSVPLFAIRPNPDALSKS